MMSFFDGDFFKFTEFILEFGRVSQVVVEGGGSSTQKGKEIFGEGGDGY